MTEDYYATRALRTGPSLRSLLLAGLLSFAGGAGLVGYLAWSGQLQLATDTQPQAQAPASPAPALSASQPSAGIDQHVADLEARLTRLDLQAGAFEGNSARAEGLLVALAARRAIEQGRPLGYLEPQLQARFSSARPDAVKTVIAAAKTPVTLDRLAAELDQLGPTLIGQIPNESGWQSFWRTVSNLFVVRQDDGSDRPASVRLDQVRFLLRNGQIEDAVRELAQLPGSATAKDWIARARGYAAVEAALAQIEEAALTEPERLKGGNGEAIKQPGISATPVPGAKS